MIFMAFFCVCQSGVEICKLIIVNYVAVIGNKVNGSPLQKNQKVKVQESPQRRSDRLATQSYVKLTCGRKCYFMEIINKTEAHSKKTCLKDTDKYEYESIPSLRWVDSSLYGMKQAHSESSGGFGLPITPLAHPIFYLPSSSSSSEILCGMKDEEIIFKRRLVAT